MSDLRDVTPGLVPVYGRTTLNDDQHLLAAEFSLRNDGALALTGPLLVAIDNLSDPAVMAIEPDGRLPDGRPYWNLSTGEPGEALAQGESSNVRVLKFRNPTLERFTFQWQALGNFNVGPTDFTSTPLRQIEVDHVYRYVASAADPEGQSLSYSLVSGPEGMSVDPLTGEVTWHPVTDDVGDHWVTLRASDPFGMTSEQTFTLSVLANLQNRPPTFISTPETDATVAGAFDVVTVGVQAQPTGLAAGDFGSGNLSMIAVSQGTQTLTLSPGLGSERFGEPSAINVGEPPPTQDVLLGGIDVDLGLPAFTSSADENAVGAFDQGDFNGDGYLDLVTSIYFAFRPSDYNTVRQRR